MEWAGVGCRVFDITESFQALLIYSLILPGVYMMFARAVKRRLP